jgi:hypothetical protein
MGNYHDWDDVGWDAHAPYFESKFGSSSTRQARTGRRGTITT